MEEFCKIFLFFIVAVSTLNQSNASNCTEDRIYDESRSLCLVKAEKDCVRGNKDCVPNSQCEPFRGRHICRCGSDTFQTPTGLCVERPLYGESCDKENYCRSWWTYKGAGIRTNLKCTNETCLCVSGASPTRNDPPSSSHGEFRCGKHPASYCDKEWDCVENAECKWERCRCKPGFFIRTVDASQTQTCEKKKEFGEICGENEECNEAKHLVCNSALKTCECTEDTSYQSNLNECLKKEGSPCNSEETSHECVSNAYCGSSTPMSSKCECLDHATTSPTRKDGHCYIKEKFECDTNSIYFKDLPQNSNYSRICRPGLVCQNYTCSCVYQAHQVYSDSEEGCLSLVGGPCTKDGDCVASSECVSSSTEGGIKFCRCKAGFSPVDRRCDLAYGEKCAQHDKSVFCDRVAGLGCSAEGRCECMGLQTYYEKEGKCRALVGGKCDDKLKCVDGAECKVFRSLEGGESGICECGFQFILGPDRSCVSRGAHMTFGG